MSRGRRHVARAIAAVLLAVAVSGCATSGNVPARRGAGAGRRLGHRGGLLHEGRAGGPGSARLQDLARARDAVKASNAHMDAAREFDREGRPRERAGRVPQGRSSSRRATRRRSHRRGELERQAAREGRGDAPPAKIDAMRERARRQTEGPILNPTSKDAAQPELRHQHAPIQDILKFIGDITGINVIVEQGAQSVVARPDHAERLGRHPRAGAEPGDDRQSALVQGHERPHHPGHPGHRAEAAAVRGADHPDLLRLARRPAGDLQR